MDVLLQLLSDFPVCFDDLAAAVLSNDRANHVR